MSAPNTRATADRISWYWEPEEDNGRGRFTGLRDGYLTVARVDYAEEGEAEGGLAALARFMVGALRPDAEQAPLSPAGWWWQGTTEERGRWRKGGPFATPEEARDACTAAFVAGAYLREE